ncbi:MAG: hypothetical protein ABI627_13950 [Polyangiaceae bacterium]
MRRLFIGQVTVMLDGWEHLRTELRIQTETFGGKAWPPDERYLISRLPARRRAGPAVLSEPSRPSSVSRPL